MVRLQALGPLLSGPRHVALVAAVLAVLAGIARAEDTKPNADQPPVATPESHRAAEQQHLEILARLSEAHRQLAAEVAALTERRAALTREIDALTKRRQNEAQALARVEAQRRDMARQLAAVREALAAETARLAALQAEPPPAQAATPPLAAVQASGSGADATPPRGTSAAEAPRVVVRYSSLHRRGAEIAWLVADRLVQHGYTLAEVRAVQAPVRQADVRYFFPEDRDASDLISTVVTATLRAANATAAAAQVRDFTRAPAKPSEGTLEVRVPAE